MLPTACSQAKFGIVSGETMKKARNKEQSSPKPDRQRVRTDRGILGRTTVMMVLCGILAFIPVVGMLLNLMVFRHEEYAKKALANQTRVTSINASRGTIYDRNMNVLAASASVENVFLDPYELKRSKADIDLVANTLSGILNVDADFIREQAADTKMRYKLIASKRSTDETDQVRAFINQNGIEGIHMEPNSKRYYPYSTLASQVVGFTNASNSGAEGIESYYNRYLEGTAGKVITTKGNYETDMPFSFEKYYEATQGYNIVLTLDTTVQYYLEKNLENAMERYHVSGGAFGVVMDAKTGEILAMANLDGYDPNNYLEIKNPYANEELEKLRLTYLAEPEGSEDYEKALEAYNDALVDARLKQWRNRCISDGYEPGSSFKVITLAAAFEEGTATENSTYYCGGAENIPGRSQTLHCWRHQGHGSETAKEALMDSCNISFAHIALDLGGDAFYDYIKAFGLMEKTGVDMAGESAGYFYSKELLTDNAKYGTSYLTSTSFGQTFKITPLQLVRAIAAVVNGGYVLEPYIVSEILDEDGNVVEKNEPTVLRQAISKETSDTMRRMVEAVVAEGTGSNAQVAGYRIGGKTATAEKTDVFDENGHMVDDKIISFVGVAPMDDPQYIVLVSLDTPSADSGYRVTGGLMGAVTAREVMADILPHLGVSQDYTNVDMSRVAVSMPELTGMTRQEAEAALKEASLTCRYVGEGTQVTDQIPAGGVNVPGNSEVILYMGSEAPNDEVTVPDFRGKSVSQVNQLATDAGLYLLPAGTDKVNSLVYATTQSIEPSIKVPRGTMVKVEFTDHTEDE